MFTIEKIQSLNELEMSVYQYVIQHQNTIPYMRIRELAAEVHVSTTTILRFCKKLGCDGYAEFKLRLKESAGQQNIARIPEDLSELKAFLERVESPPYQQKLDEAAAMIAKADRVLCVGVSNSGYIAQYAARYFSTFGKFSTALTDPFYPVWQLDDSSTTVALVFSISGEVAQTSSACMPSASLMVHSISIQPSSFAASKRCSPAIRVLSWVTVMGFISPTALMLRASSSTFRC